MRWLAAGWLGLGLFSMADVVQAGAPPTPEQQYAHIQDLNNAAYILLHPRQDETFDLHALPRASALLEQSLAALDRLQAQTDAADALDLAGRRFDALLRLAQIDALQGRRAAALDRLDEWRALPLHASDGQLLERQAALNGLHGEPRYQRLIADLKSLGDRWNATAFQVPPAGLDEAHRIAGLSLFWSEARYNFVWFDHVPELDWNRTYLDFLPKVIAAGNAHDYYDVLMRLAPLLRDGHTNIYPPASMMEAFYAKPPLATALVEGRVLVTALRSPAPGRAGVQVGDEVVAVDGQEVHAYAQQRVAPYVSSSTPQDRQVRMYDYQLLMGDHRQPVALTLRDADGRVRTVALSREKDPQSIPLPAIRWKMLDGGVAYLAIDEFEDDRGLQALLQHLPEIRRAKGLLLDVRRNGGGSSGYGLKMLSWLSGRPIPLSRSRSIDYSPVFRAWGGPYAAWRDLGPPGATYDSPHERYFAGPVAVLIGPRTFSAAEDFVVSFAAMRRGLMVGERTGGSSGQPLVFTLPGGGTARICAKRDSRPDGSDFVGVGIAPDVTVRPTVAGVRAGRDPVIEQAVRLLREKTAAAPGVDPGGS